MTGRAINTPTRNARLRIMFRLYRGESLAVAVYYIRINYVTHTHTHELVHGVARLACVVFPRDTFRTGDPIKIHETIRDRYIRLA